MKVYFIGIGGIGMSALARYYLSQGHKVLGSDRAHSEIVRELIEQGVDIKIGHRRENISQELNLVIYSAAIPKKNPELKQARKLGIKTQRYSEALGDITKRYYTICVSGTHGKSTTTAMLSLILIRAGLNPTVILGTKLKEFGNSNFRPGDKPLRPNSHIDADKSKVLVIEADEWQESFLNYHPDVIVVTNIDREHLDYYKTFSNLIRAFKKFIHLISQSGILILNHDDRVLSKIKLDDLGKVKTFFYSRKQKEAGTLREILKVPGQHNLSNALAALGAARALGIKDKTIFETLSSYQGAWRRFSSRKIQIKEKGQEKREITLIDDYAHHPTEIQATLQAARERFGKRKIWVVFQPHQISRTKLLFSQFTYSFRRANRVIIADIYRVAGRDDNCSLREKKDLARRLATAIQKNFSREGIPQKKAIYLGSQRAIKDYLIRELKGGEIVMIMGAGDIYNLAQDF